MGAIAPVHYKNVPGWNSTKIEFKHRTNKEITGLSQELGREANVYIDDVVRELEKEINSMNRNLRSLS